jgi:hypothetical protein
MVTETQTRKGNGHEEWHGTTNGYTNYKCRCAKCRAAWNAYISDYRTRRYAKKERLYCTVDECSNLESIAAGNGLCDKHAKKLKLLRQKKEREAQLRKTRRLKKKKVVA